MKKKNKIFILVALILAVGLTAFILYLFFQNNKDASDVTDIIIKDRPTSITDNYAKEYEKGKFDGLLIGFNYPSSGWVVEDFDDEGGLTVRSDDYETDGTGATAGTAIIVSRFHLEEDFTSVDDFINHWKEEGSIDSVTTINRDGLTGYKYDCSAFCEQISIISKGETSYMIAYYPTSDSTDEIYESFIDSFVIK